MAFLTTGCEQTRVHAAGTGSPAGSVMAAAAPSTSGIAEYQTHVQPILQANCYRCHGGMNRRGGLQMQTRAALLEGGKHGPALIPGKPDDSLMLRLIGPGPYPDGLEAMPPKGKLSEAEAATLRQWIASGAAMDK